MRIEPPPADPLSDLLQALDARAECSVRLEIGGDWSIRFSPTCIKFNAVNAGGCWLILGHEPPVRLEAGDCFVYAGGDFVLASDPRLEPIPAAQAFEERQSLRVTQGSDEIGPGYVSMLAGSVVFPPEDDGMLRGILPPLSVISAEAPGSAALRGLLTELDREWRTGGPGSAFACGQLMQLMFVHALRCHIATLDGTSNGWLAGLADPPIAAALHAIHAEPARNWRLEELARIAGSSRSSFSERFRIRVGIPAIDYATRWRMTLAASKLRTRGETMSSIAASLGYLSDSAFSATFRRVHGTSPAQYRQTAKVANSSTRAT